MATINVKDAAGSTVAIEQPNANGRAAAASSRPIAIANEDFAAIGATNETAPGSDTATAGLNGRLQRVAQRLTSLIGFETASTAYHLISAATNNATNLKSSAGTLDGFVLSNNNANDRYFKLYNKATAPAPASDTVVYCVRVPGNSVVSRSFPKGLSFSTGISFAVVVNMSDTDNTAITAGDMSIDIEYK
jgi:hypothetical protein